MSAPAQSVELSLISHTNVGKTTLARTLLGRDIGEIRDAPHVTEIAEPHLMIETTQGDALRLWDTPGFGDSARLAGRMRQWGNPIGWFLTQVWDRWRDRPFWSSQQAVKNVREQADVVLYLVSAAEDPQDAGYLVPEMQILEWIGKPVLVLLNQVGTPRPRAEEEAEEARWRDALAAHQLVHRVLTLDAFARCWVHEITLLTAVHAVLPEVKRSAFDRLDAAWQGRRMQQFDQAMAALAGQIARTALDRETLGNAGLRGKLRELGEAIGLVPGETAKERAMAKLATRLDAEVRASTDRMIAIHGLEGRAAAEILERVASDFDLREGASEGKAAMLGGLVSGAASGLAADLAAGGLTFGAGLLAGSVLGAMGGAGLARGFNVLRGADVSSLAWTDDFVRASITAALLRDLAVAHYGRGRGAWQESEYPAFWKDIVAGVLAVRAERLTAILAARTAAGSEGELAPALQGFLSDSALAVFDELYGPVLHAGVADIATHISRSQITGDLSLP